MPKDRARTVRWSGHRWTVVVARGNWMFIERQSQGATWAHWVHVALVS